MTPDQWKLVDHFDISEKWGIPAIMDPALIFELDRLRKYIDRKIEIHCGYEKRDSGFHPLGKAVDCHAEGLHPIEFYIAATRFKFNGIGAYLWWNNPGLHLDTRPLKEDEPRAVWGSTGPKKYVAFDNAFLRLAAQIVVA